MKKGLSLILVLALILSLGAVALFTANAEEAGEYIYEKADEEGTTVRITEYRGNGGDVVIPDTIGGLPVTEIGEEAFAYYISLSSVVIPEGVTRIGDRAFMSCGYMTTLTLPLSVTEIGTEAFIECTSLVSVLYGGTQPDRVNIEMEDGNDELTAATWLYTEPEPSEEPSEDPSVEPSDEPSDDVSDEPSEFEFERIDGGAAALRLVRYTGVGGRVVIPEAIDGVPVTEIGDEAFAGCETLTDITIPKTVVRIGKGAFRGCKNLATVTFGGTRVDQFSIQISDGNEVLGGTVWSCQQPNALGDANSDGSVDMKDVLVIRKHIASFAVEIDQTASDVDLDSGITMKDVLMIRKFIAGLIGSFA